MAKRKARTKKVKSEEPFLFQNKNGTPEQLDVKTLETWLWEAACSIRGAVDAPKYKDYIVPLIFIKRLSDVFEDEVKRIAKKLGDEERARDMIAKDHTLVRFYIPSNAQWKEIRRFTSNIGQQLTDAMRAISKQNPKLQGVIDIVDFNANVSGQRIVDDGKLSDLIEIISKHRLGLADCEPDILGRAYDYLLRKFAEGQGQSAGEFLTPKEVGWLLAYILDPKEGQTVYDPCAGTAGLLVKMELRLQEKMNGRKVSKPLQLFGQEQNHVTYAMAKMNMIIHDMEGEIGIGDTMRSPKFLDGSSLAKFDLVTANPMWNQDQYDSDFYENDTFNRFEFGYPPASSADWGWIQLMAASLRENGRAAIVLDTGAVSRGSGNQGTNKERDIRKTFVERDWVEAVILLPENLFYNTTAPGVILVINKSKPKLRRDKILLINASEEFEKGKPKNFISDTQITEIAEIFLGFKSVRYFSKAISNTEALKRDCNLSPSLHIGTETTDDLDDISELLTQLDSLEKENTRMNHEMKNIFRKLGIES